MSIRRQENGFVLLSILTITIFVMVMGIISLQLISNNLNSAKNERYLINAQFAADAGLDDAVRQLNLDQSWTGSGTEQTLYNPAGFKTTYISSVTPGSDIYQKFITVTAKTFAPATSTNPKYTRKYTIEMRGVSSGDYSVVTGVGGLIMSNSAKIVGGNVYVNGKITMSNTAQIGLSTNPVAVKAAHQSCPIPANTTYPRVCNSGENGQPITLTNNSKIYGEVQATNQTNGSNMSNPGLVSGSPAAVAIPDYDRTSQITAVTSTLNGNFNCSSGNMIWPANYRITGNVDISNSCNVTVNGNVWIGGSLNLSNSAKLIVSNAVGTTKPVIMVDGQSGATFSQNTDLKSNNQNTGFRVITFWSTASCSPNCTNVSGSDLYNSSTRTTINLTNSSQGPQTEFFARWTQVDVNNGGNIGALVGQTIRMSNSGAVTFGATVSGAGGIQAWVIKSYKRNF